MKKLVLALAALALTSSAMALERPPKPRCPSGDFVCDPEMTIQTDPTDPFADPFADPAPTE